MEAHRSLRIFLTLITFAAAVISTVTAQPVVSLELGLPFLSQGNGLVKVNIKNKALISSIQFGVQYLNGTEANIAPDISGGLLESLDWTFLATKSNVLMYKAPNDPALQQNEEFITLTELTILGYTEQSGPLCMKDIVVLDSAAAKLQAEILNLDVSCPVPMMPPPPPPSGALECSDVQSAPTLWEFLDTTPSVQLFAELVKSSGSLLDKLDAKEGQIPYTVFAPQNDGVQEDLINSGAGLEALNNPSESLQQQVSNHILQGSLDQTDLKNPDNPQGLFDSISGVKIKVEEMGNDLLVDGVKVTAGPFSLCNGFLYTLEKPIEFAVAAAPKPSPTTLSMSQFLDSQPGVTSIFWTLVESANMTAQIDSTTSKVTALVPPDFAFSNLFSDPDSQFDDLNDLLGLPLSTLQFLVKSYIIPQYIPGTLIYDGAQFTNLNDEKLSITVVLDGSSKPKTEIYQNSVLQAEIVLLDLFTTTGIVHYISSVFDIKTTLPPPSSGTPKGLVKLRVNPLANCFSSGSLISIDFETDVNLYQVSLGYNLLFSGSGPQDAEQVSKSLNITGAAIDLDWTFGVIPEALAVYGFAPSFSSSMQQLTAPNGYNELITVGSSISISASVLSGDGVVDPLNVEIDTSSQCSSASTPAPPPPPFSEDAVLKLKSNTPTLLPSGKWVISVDMYNPVDVAGVQFTITYENGTETLFENEGMGGTAEQYGLPIQTGTSAIIGFSLEKNVIPASTGLVELTQLTLVGYNPNADGSLCLGNLVVSNAGGVGLDSHVIGNSDGCGIASTAPPGEQDNICNSETNGTLWDYISGNDNLSIFSSLLTNLSSVQSLLENTAATSKNDLFTVFAPLDDGTMELLNEEGASLSQVLSQPPPSLLQSVTNHIVTSNISKSDIKFPSNPSGFVDSINGAHLKVQAFGQQFLVDGVNIIDGPIKTCNGFVYTIAKPISFAVAGDPPLPSEQTVSEFLGSNSGITSTFWTLLEAADLTTLTDSLAMPFTIFVPLNFAFKNLYASENSTFKSLDDLLNLPQPTLQSILKDYMIQQNVPGNLIYDNAQFGNLNFNKLTVKFAFDNADTTQFRLLLNNNEQAHILSFDHVTATGFVHFVDRVFDIDLDSIPPPAPPIAADGSVLLRISPDTICVNSSSLLVEVQYISTVPLFHFSFDLQKTGGELNITGLTLAGGAVLAGWGVAYVPEFQSIVGFANPVGAGSVPIPLDASEAYMTLVSIEFLPQNVGFACYCLNATQTVAFSQNADELLVPTNLIVDADSACLPPPPPPPPVDQSGTDPAEGGSSGGGDDNNTGVIIGAVVGSVATVVLLVLAVLLIRKKRQGGNKSRKAERFVAMGDIKSDSPGNDLQGSNPLNNETRSEPSASNQP